MPMCPQGHDSPTTDYCDYCGWPMPLPPGAAPQPPERQGAATPQPPYSQAPQQQQPPPLWRAPDQSPPTAGLVMCPICGTPKTDRYCEECGYDYNLASPPRHPSPAAPQPAQQQYGSPLPGFGDPPPAQNQGYGQQPGYPGQQQPAPGNPSPGYGAPAGTYGGVQYSTGDTSGGFGTDFLLQPPAEGQDPTRPMGRVTWVANVAADRDYFNDMMARSGPDAAGLYFPPYSQERRVPMTGRGQLRIGRRSQQRGTVPEIDLSTAPEDPGASHQHATLQEQPDGGWVVIDEDSTNGTTLNGGPDSLPSHTPIPLKDGDRIHVGAWTTITVHHA